MRQKVTVNSVRYHGLKRWQVRYHEAGKVKKQFFTGKEAAEAQATFLRGASLSADQQFLMLAQGERERLLLAATDARERGVDLLDLVRSFQSAPVSPSIEDVMHEMDALKRKVGRDSGYLDSLGQIIAMFAKGRETMAINKFTVREVESFLDSKELASRSTLRSRLSTLFKFSVRCGYRADNPCSQLEAVTIAKPPVAVFTVDEVQKCLTWLKLNPRSLAWFALSTFAGLRPEEAEKTCWSEINFTEGFVKVEAQTTKVRQRRIVYPLPMAMSWLRQAKKLKSTLPLTVKTRTADRIELRELLGWPEWKHDVTRHTFASMTMMIAHEPDIAKIAATMGNSPAVLMKDNKALTTKLEAEKFWALSSV